MVSKVKGFININDKNSLFFSSGIVQAIDNAWPAVLEFKPNFDQGSLLTIVSGFDK